MNNMNLVVRVFGIFIPTAFIQCVVAQTNTTCWSSGLDSDEVVVEINGFTEICPPPLGNYITYFYEKTNDRESISGCIVDGHYPEGYTYVDTGTTFNCAGNPRVTWWLNQKPVGVGMTIYTAVDTPYTGSAATTDPDGDALRYYTGHLPEKLVVNANTGAFFYTPATGFEGTEQLWMWATDGKGGESPIVAFANVGDHSIDNDPPVFNGFTATLFQGERGGVLLSATDPDGDPVTIVLDSNEQPVHGALTPGSMQNVYFYESYISYIGGDSFAAIASDNRGNSTRAVITIEVQALPPAGDYDNDGMSNAFELEYGFDPYADTDAGIDSDMDGASNLEEFLAGSNPRNPGSTPEVLAMLAYLIPVISLILF